MSKKFLTFALAALTAGSALALGPKRGVVRDGNLAFPDFKVEAKKKIPTRADAQSIDYTLADEIYTVSQLQGVPTGTVIYQAFEFTGETATKFKGDRITSVNITTGALNSNNNLAPNVVRDVTVFLTKSLDAEPFYTQKGELGTDYATQYNIALDTPCEIKEGEGIFIGYYFTHENSNMYYLAVDGIPNEDDLGAWVGIPGDDGKVVWSSICKQIGNLCIGCTIAGDNLPQNGIELVDVAGPLYCAPGKPFEYNFLVRGTGVSATELELTYTLGDSEPQSETFQVTEPLLYNQYAILSVEDLINTTEGLAVPLKFEISKVNGVENTCDINTFSSTINCFPPEKGFPRVHLIEEGTGTWCGFCPLGIVMMEYVGEKYPDFFARVAIHASTSGVTEPMYQQSTSSWISRYGGSYPCGYIDRVTDIEALSYANYEMMISEMDKFVSRNKDVPALLGFTGIDCSIDESGKMTVDTKVRSAFDMPNDNRYRIGFYLTQDSVGPYRQSNYYAANAYGPCGGWESKGKTVSIKYNEVCRLLSGNASGFSNSLPAELKADEESTYTTAINVFNVNADTFKLIAFIYDSESGEIANAKVVDVVNTYYISGIDGVSAEDAEVVARRFYNLNGVEVSEPANGLYIVRTVYSDGTVKSAKVMVK